MWCLPTDILHAPCGSPFFQNRVLHILQRRWRAQCTPNSLSKEKKTTNKFKRALVRLPESNLMIWNFIFLSTFCVFVCVFFVFIALNLFACCCSSTTGKKSAQNGKLKEMNRGRIELEHRSLLFLLPFYRIYFLVFFLHERNGSNGNSPKQLR